VCYSCKPFFNAVFFSEAFELSAIESGSVIRNDSSGKPKMIDDILDDEVDHFLCRDGGHWLSFSPFGEVIDSDNCVL